MIPLASVNVYGYIVLQLTVLCITCALLNKLLLVKLDAFATTLRGVDFKKRGYFENYVYHS